MSEQTSNELAIAGSAAVPVAANSDLDMQNPDLEEKSASTRVDSMLGNLDLLRQIILVLSVAICVALIVLVVAWLKEPEMRPLGNFSTEELIPILDHFDQKQIEYQLEGNTIRVPADKYGALKLELTRAGLNNPTAEGDDILLQDMGFGVSQRLEQERLKLSRERQLARAIEQIRQVRKAQVLLAMPKQSVFVRHNQEATASVFLTLSTGGTLGQQEVDSIVDMVSTAVPGLKPSRVTVTDQHGRLLSSGTEDPAATARRKEYELERKQEQALREKIDAILIPVLGLGNYTSQVDVSMDFSAQEETQKRFDPNTPSTRSEYTLEDYNNGQAVAGIPGALSNQPPQDSAIPQDVIDLQTGKGGNGSVHREATRNFELDTTIRHKRSQTGTISRQTVSVAVNYKPQLNPETGEMTRVPVTEEELVKIRRLLMGGVGFLQDRGDMLEVISVPFATQEQERIVDLPIWEHPNFNTWIRWLAAALVIIVVLVVLVRPAMRKLLYPNQAADGTPLDENGLPIMAGEGSELIGADLDGVDGIDLTNNNLDLPNLHKDDDLLKAVRALVANEPDLAAQVVKNWVYEDGK
ncbi:flagellar basal-body MS-ring/collar protein FliF [Photobacterium halotolerans]|uniref:Flagellar M-ring protein n=1 Tax=Photobacterium halotolerans TaxID=265726 RepID=A0A7X4XX12_9GAMM|nr:flagellar basal-body MS-ring/collar protein FliF [Photobacterium halotolerans]NAW64720.1 flagellar basal body M-ring protein FliF [Photobacterium halotolerans]NAW85973.1 flagellar basal body M-ring protein FliF [Photobacterium halotolerans]NAX46837.1 flagellar basal body M-ring protein FliF [Photobacterium halotolerans]